MEQVIKPFSWKVCLFDINSKKLIEHDILKYREKLVKELKKSCPNKEEFVDKLFRDFMWQYWSRSEYEMLIYLENERVFVQPWIGFQKPEAHRVDVTDRPDFDWVGFAKQQLHCAQRNIVKIDVYDQLRFRFDELADFCWEYKHKYQRNIK